MPTCNLCPAAFPIQGADRHHQAVLCRINSTNRGQQNGRRGPVDLVRATESTASYYGYCLGDLEAGVRDVEAMGPTASPNERDFAVAARRSGASLCYHQCPTWRAEKANRLAAKLADQPGQRRTHGIPE